MVIMKALIAFVIMAAVILTLIEINERRKAKDSSGKTALLQEEGSNSEGQKAKDESPDTENAASEEAACDDPEDEDCSACELVAVCEKKDKGESK